MYKLIYRNRFAEGFDVDQVVGNLAQLLQLSPKTVRLFFLSQDPRVIKIVESSAEAELWRSAFLEAGVYLDIANITPSDIDSIADEIEFDLQLHSHDEDSQNEIESPRQLLVKKIVARGDADTVQLTEVNSDPAFSVYDENTQEENLPDGSEVKEQAFFDGGFDDVYANVKWYRSLFFWGILIIVLAIVATATTILWLKRPLWQPLTVSVQNEKIISALATDALFALVHADVPRLQRLPEILQPGTGLKNLPEPEMHFWRKLEESGVEIAQQLDQLWISVYRVDNSMQPLWILTGKFEPDIFREWLKKNYAIDEDSPHQILFSAINQDTCEKHLSMVAIIEPNQIILGAPERVDAFRERLDRRASADRDLSDWSASSANQMLSVGFFSPAQLSDTSAAMVFSKFPVDVAQVKGIYIGVAPRMLPPVLEFNTVVVSENQEFINKVETAIKPIITDAKNTVAQDWPETLGIYQRMRLSKTEQQLRATVHFDETLQSQLQLWVNSLFVRTFSTSDSAANITDEWIDERPRVFADLQSSTLPDFSVNSHLNAAFSSQSITGPFGLGISSIEATPQGTLVTLDVNAFNLPNLGKEAGSVELRVLDIVDHQDQSLLGASACDVNGVRRVANIDLIYDGIYFDQGQPTSYLGIQGSKKILLPENIEFSTVGAIKGEVGFDLPLNIERIKVDLPLAGKVIDSHGLQVRFFSSDPSRLYFQSSGNTSALLQVNALNAEGKVLATTNTMREASLFSGSKTTSIDVQGAIAAVEVVVASKMEKQIYPFRFDRIQPQEKPFEQEKTAPELLTKESLVALKKDSPPVDMQYAYETSQQTIIAGPALIAVNQMNIEARQLLLIADILLRNQHPLTRQLNAVRFFVTEVEDSAGGVHPVNIQVPIALDHIGGGWVDGKFQADPAQPWLRGLLDLRGQDLGVDDVNALWGKLVFFAASDVTPVQLPFQFGMQWNGADSSFKLVRWEAGRLIFDVNGSFPELMAITALDETGQPVSQAAELRTSLGVNQVELPIKQRPATIEFSVARKQDMEEFSFEIRAQQ